MANPFDQFDQPAANPFDKFDASSGNPFDQFDAPETSLWEDIKIPAVQAVNALDTGVTLAGAGLGTLVGDKNTPEEDDALFKAMQARQAERTQWANPREAEQSFGAKLGGTVATLPLQMASLPGQSAERMRQMVDAGESAGSAQTAGLIDTALNIGSVALPAAFGTKLATKLATGAAANVATGAASDVVTQAVSEKEATKKMFDPANLEARAMEAIIGGGFGAVAGKGKKSTPAPTDFKSRLDALDKVKEEQKLTQGEGTLYVGKDGDVTTDLPGLVKETPEQVEIARTEMQNNLQREATTREEPAQGELFLEEPVQGELDLRTKAEVLATNEAKNRTDTGSLGTPETFGTQNRALIDSPLGKDQARKADLDVRALDSYDKATGEFSISELFNKLTATTTPEFRPYGALMQRMVQLFEKMPEAERPRFAIELLRDQADPTKIVDPDHVMPMAANKLTGAFEGNAHYDPNTNTVWIGRRGLTEGTVVHEAVHSLTSRMLWVLDPKDPLVRDIHTLYKRVSGDPRFADQYGIATVHEFIAEAFSSPEFQKRLSEIKFKNPDGSTVNGFKKFVQDLAKLLGFKVADKQVVTALELLIKRSSAVMDTYSKEAADINKEFLDKYPASLQVPNILPSKMNSLIADVGGTPKATNQLPVSQISDEHTAKADVIENTSGELYIPKDPIVDEAMINKIKAEKDGSGTWALTPGALSRAELANSTLVKTVYRFMNNAFKRAEYKTNQIVKPTQETFTKLLRSPQKAAMSHEILMREMRRGEDYTTEELRGIGVPDDLIKAHLEFRSMMQQALEAQNMVLRDKGLPPVKGIDAYVSSRWSGPWRANVKDAEGNIIWQVAEHSKKKAQDAIEWIKTKQPELKIEDPAYRKGFEKGDDVEAGYLDMLKALDKEDPRVAVLESIYKDYITGNTENVASQEKHFLRKKGVRGFAGDRPWSENDVRDFFVQQFAYAENSFKWSESQKGIEGVKKLVNDPILQETQKNNIQFSKEYTKGQLGFGTSATFDAIDNGLAEMTGLSPQKLQEYMGAGKTFFYLSKLGLSVPFTLTQFLQPAITTPAWHSKLDSMGYKHNPVVTTLKSITGGASAALWHYSQYFNSKELSKAAELGMSKLDREAARYMESNGVIDINPMTDIKKGLRPAAVKTIAAPFEFTIKHSEIIARSNAFMGFVSHLEQSGKYDTSSAKGRMELFQKAEDMTNLSMTDYRSQERAMVFEKMGLAGDAAATLHTYQINNLMQLVKFSKEAANGNVMPLFYMMAMQSVAAGLTGLWFVEDLDDFLSNLKKLLPHDQFMKVKDFSLKNFILKHAGDVAGYGLVSKATGTNIHTRMNASNQIPIWPFESQEDPIKNVAGLAPFAESLYDTGMGAAQAVAPGSTPQERMQGLYAAAPTVAQGPMENLPAFSDAGVSLKPRDLGQGKIRRTEEEKSLRNLGLKSTREQKQADQEFGLSKIERQVQDRLNTASKKAVEFAVSGDGKNASEQMIKYIELGGDPQTLVARIPQAKLNRVTTELERRAIGASAGTRAAILKLKRYMDQVTQ